MQFVSNIAQFLLVVGISFAVLTLIVSFIRFQNVARRAVESDQAIDPHDAFQVQIANRLGTAHLEPEPFLVMVLVPDGVPSAAATHYEKLGMDRLELFAEYIRKMLRGTDTVVQIGNSRIGAIVDAPRENAEAIVQRLREAFRGSPGRSTSFSFCVGVSAHPEDGTLVKALVESATASLEEAVLRGRGQLVLAAGAGSASSAAPVSAAAATSSALDPLTGVLRKERLGGALQKYVAQYRKRDLPVSVLVLEVDHFERYGEHYGPSAGDEILQRLGGFLQESVREADLVGRLDGNTFLVAMACAPRAAMIAAQRMINAARKIAFPVSGSSLRISICLGVAGYPDHGGHPRHLVEFATAALQAAQENGRGMCLAYEPTMRPANKTTGPAETF